MDHKISKEPQDSSYDDQEKWVHDSSKDIHGNLPLRAKTGAWKASLFIIAMEYSERLSYFGLATNMIVYLTEILHQDLTMAVKNMNYWMGVTALMPLLGGFVADAYVGRYATVLVATIIYLMGLILLTLSWFIPGLKPCAASHTCVKPRKAHEMAFFVAIYLIAVGTGGHKPSLESFGADQFDDDHDEERMKKMSYFNWWNSFVCAGILTAVTVVVYVEDRIGWGVAAVILTVVMATSLAIFLAGRPFYRYRSPAHNPLMPIFHVLVAAFAKRNLPYPSDASKLYEVPKAQYTKTRLLYHTESLKCLDKAAIIEDFMGGIDKQSPWRLATVTKVEEVKLLINMIPIWFSTVAFGICAIQATSFFVKQSLILDRHIGRSFEIPPASMFCLTSFSMMITVASYEKLLVPLMRRATGNERGISILQRIGTGLIFALITMMTSALVEKKRLDHVAHHVTLMSTFWLAPQFILSGVADAFTLVGLQEYFYDQVPDTMRSLGIAFYLSIIGVASFVNNFLISVVDHVSHRISGHNLFGADLNSSRLDRFYWFLAGLAAANICVYVVVAMRYSYKSVRHNSATSDVEIASITS